MKKSKVGMVTTANNGMEMKIIAYRSANDIDVQFADGTIVTNKSYAAFDKGSIRNPNKRNISEKNGKKVGETVRANNGQMMTIVAYRHAKDIDVRFEDGTLVSNREYYNFKKGEIWNPNCPTVRVPKNNRTGETITSNCGQKMTIIAYRNCADIDVQFEDGTVIKNKTYKAFSKGAITNPELQKAFRMSKIGETSRANNGQMMTIIAYKNANNIDVRFEDNTVVKKTRYPYFKKGLIANPSLKRTR